MRSSRSQLVCLTVCSPAIVGATSFFFFSYPCRPGHTGGQESGRRHVPLDAGCSQNPGQRKEPEFVTSVVRKRMQ